MDLIEGNLNKIEGDSIIIKCEKNDSTSYKEYLMGISRSFNQFNNNIEIYTYVNKRIKREPTTNFFWIYHFIIFFFYY